ncbi:LOW QUALITY PROTEIN: calcitonin gene-related peptide 1 [Rousettus aegyptiacus]|uniref:LOW QUALITY PROTEIN: calcitonin gene-related peptide 1 n=1 Tax=Rousettus aegyptiacus TaxID=9407 RepID=UPI00168D2CC2|nr:LOW QUALITY PROTEIN: calcitonin gene-related peptide 1 [Rousettus aegyptiacus]
MTQSELGWSWPLWIGRAGSWGPLPPTITGIRAKSSAGKTPTAGVVSIRGDRLLEFSSTSRRQRDIMGFWKSSPFLAFSILVLCQAGGLQAAPFRSSLESLPDPAALSEKEGRLLLAALVNAYVQRKTNELDQEQETEGSSITAQKRACNTATCVTHRLADLLSRSGDVMKSNFVPTDVGSNAFGRRRRELQA